MLTVLDYQDYQNWEPCDQNNYWNFEEGYITIVQVTINDQTYVYTYSDCPYDWNALIDKNAYKLDINLHIRPRCEDCKWYNSDSYCGHSSSVDEPIKTCFESI